MEILSNGKIVARMAPRRLRIQVDTPFVRYGWYLLLVFADLVADDTANRCAADRSARAAARQHRTGNGADASANLCSVFMAIPLSKASAQQVHTGQIDERHRDSGTHHPCLMETCSMFFDRIFEGIFGILDDLFDIPKRLLRFALDLFFQTFGFLFLVSNQFPSLLLNFAGSIFNGALDLVFVDHGYSLSELGADQPHEKGAPLVVHSIQRLETTY
jgi:hypothetical protein